ncbi:hypothetical protein ACFFRE_04200 [Aciditerrimonas ferrireducens]|uniref:Uncharacterized protein n=1 Tax=Aciditerrimonas ferrireducens TaxID=667306 RepID=A0ABV6C530_9ACTN
MPAVPDPPRGEPAPGAPIPRPPASTDPPADPAAAPDQDGTGSLTALAAPMTRFERALQVIPRALSSKVHVLLLLALGLYLVVLPLLGVTVSAKAELIGGNYTNVTSDVGACIAAGGTLHLIRQTRRRHRLEQERLRLTTEVHALLCRAHPELAESLGVGAADLPTGSNQAAG